MERSRSLRGRYCGEPGEESRGLTSWVGAVLGAEQGAGRWGHGRAGTDGEVEDPELGCKCGV